MAVLGGEKMMYLNTSIRGYPKGLRAGLDPRKPIIEVDDGFTMVKYRAIPYPLVSVRVWGCGSQQSRFVTYYKFILLHLEKLAVLSFHKV
jgi:hypothetical protein